MCSRAKLCTQRCTLDCNKSPGYTQLPEISSPLSKGASRLHTYYFTQPPGDVHLGEDVKHRLLLHRELLQLQF